MTEQTGAGSEIAAQVRRGRPPRVRDENSGPQREPTGRGDRIPLGVRRQKLIAEHREGYSRRWINDNGARIEQALQGGWEFVLKDGKATSTDPGDRVSHIVDTSTGMRAYLMEIRQDWFDEDQAAKKAQLDKTEALIKAGKLGSNTGDGIIVPDRGISIRRGPLR